MFFVDEVEAKRAEIALTDQQEYTRQYKVEELMQEDCEDLGLIAVFHCLVQLPT